MASQTWTKTSSGNVLDTQGNIVGTGNGAGVITITAATVFVGPATDTLLITEGVTVRFAASSLVSVRCSAGGNTSGTFRVTGTEDEPCVLTSDAGSPAPGDWDGIVWFGAVAGDLTGVPVVEFTYTTVEYYVTITTQVLAGAVPQGFTALQCTFRRSTGPLLSHNGGEGDAFPWNISFCCFITCVGDFTTPTNQIQCISGGIPAGAQRALMNLNHCSFLYQDNISSDVFAIQCGSRSRMVLKNSVVVVTNAGAGGGNILNLGPTGPVFSNNNNFYWAVDSDLQEEYPPAASDQNVDPEYFSSICASANLSPNAQAGSPDLYLASDDGIFVGAKEPYNLPSAGTLHRYWIHSGEDAHLLYNGAGAGARFWQSPAGEANISTADPETDVGWTVLRDGYITGIAAVFQEHVFIEQGTVEAEVWVNGVRVLNVLSPTISDLPGTPTMFQWKFIQPIGIDAIQAGDKIQIAMHAINVPDPDGFLLQVESTTKVVVELSYLA